MCAEPRVIIWHAVFVYRHLDLEWEPCHLFEFVLQHHWLLLLRLEFRLLLLVLDVQFLLPPLLPLPYGAAAASATAAATGAAAAAIPASKCALAPATIAPLPSLAPALTPAAAASVSGAPAPAHATPSSAATPSPASPAAATVAAGVAAGTPVPPELSAVTESVERPVGRLALHELPVRARLVHVPNRLLLCVAHVPGMERIERALVPLRGAGGHTHDFSLA